MADRNIIRVEGSDREFHRLRILFVVLLPLAMSLMAVSSVNVALPTIETGLGASPTDLQWILSGYALAFGILLIPSGRAGDVLGRGSLFILGLTVMVGASLVCGLASDPLVLNAGRLLQGVGSGIFNPQIIGMIQQYFDGAGRARAFALFGLVISVSVAVGPILAGGIIAAVGPELGWRAAFLVNLPLGVLGLVLALAWFPFESERRLIRAAREARRAGTRAPLGGIDLDPIGSVILAAAVLAIMLPFMVHDDPRVWLLLPVAGVLFFAWLRWERAYTARGRAPMVDLRLFTFPSFTFGTGVSSIMFLGAATTFVLVALYLQSGLGASALETGLVGLPNAIASGFASIWAGGQVLKRGRAVVVGGLALMATGCLCSIGVAAAIAAWGIPFWWLALTLTTNGIGMGIIGSANQTLSLLYIPRHAGGTAGGVKQTAERISTAMGNAMITGLFFAVQAVSDWSVAFMVGFSAIAAVVLVSMTVAIADWRHHRAVA